MKFLQIGWFDFSNDIYFGEFMEGIDIIPIRQTEAIQLVVCDG